MRHRIAAALALTLMLPACADTSGNETAEPSDEAARACVTLLAEGTAYLEQHTAHRQERLKFIRFASEADMNAYNELTDTFKLHSVNMPGLRELIESQHGLPETTEVYTFEETTDQGAEARIEFANDCALKLLE